MDECTRTDELAAPTERVDPRGIPWIDRLCASALVRLL